MSRVNTAYHTGLWLEKQFRRHMKELCQLLGLGFTDYAFSVEHLGRHSLGTEQRPDVFVC